jgi:hypothetical protein
LLDHPVLFKTQPAIETLLVRRCMTLLVEKSVPFDLRMLRSFRCLRPLKMVSKVPSKSRTVARLL